MKKTVTTAIAAMPVLLSAGMAVSADAVTTREPVPTYQETDRVGGVRIGYLTCDIGGGVGYVIGSAKQADCVVFAPEEPTQADAVAYWAATGAVRRGMRRSVSGFRWAWSFLSTRSFRRTAAGRRRGGHGT